MRLPRLTARAFDDLALYCCGFGLFVGVVFPYLLVPLGVSRDVARRPGLQAACLAAGAIVGGVNYAIARLVVGARLRTLIGGMRLARASLGEAVATGDWSGCDPEHCHVRVDSDDELGEAAASHNRLLEAVAHAHQVEHAIAEITAALASQLDLDTLCRTALRELRDRTGVQAAAISLQGAPHLFTSGCFPAEPPIEAVAASVWRQALVDGVTPGTGICRTVDGRLVAFALHAHGQTLGVLLLAEHVPSGQGSPTDQAPGMGWELTGEPGRLLEVVATGLGVALSNALLHRQVARQASVDALTGLANRRIGLSRLEEYLSRAVDGGPTLGVLMVDVDHFKQVNDHHGHLVGDQMLSHVADTCRRALPRSDDLVRYGGEEFLAVLRGIDPAALALVAETLRAAVDGSPLSTPMGPIHVTVSVGAAHHSCLDPDGETDRAETLLSLADRALYAAKEAGRNRIISAAWPSRVSS